MEHKCEKDVKTGKLNSDIWLALPRSLLQIVYDYAICPSLFEVVKLNRYDRVDGMESNCVSQIIAAIKSTRSIPSTTLLYTDNEIEDWIDRKFIEINLDLSVPVYIVIEGCVWPRRITEDIIYMSNVCPKKYSSSKNGYDLVCCLVNWDFSNNQFSSVDWSERNVIWRMWSE